MKQASAPLEVRFKFIFSRYFIERTCESAKFQNSLSILLRNNQQGDHSVFVSCWAFLCRYRIGLLAEPTRSRMGKRPAFFIFRTRPRVQDHNRRGRPMLLSVCPASHHPATAGIIKVRQASLLSAANLVLSTFCNLTLSRRLLVSSNRYSATS